MPKIPQCNLNFEQREKNEFHCGVFGIYTTEVKAGKMNKFEKFCDFAWSFAQPSNFAESSEDRLINDHH